MTDTETAPAETDFIFIERFRAGRKATEELMVTFQPAVPPLPPVVVIASEWRPTRQTFGRWASFDVREVPTDLPGRAFLLGRDREAVAKDPDGTTRYAVLISDQPGESRCECKGFDATQPHGRTCRHVAAMTHLIATGRL